MTRICGRRLSIYLRADLDEQELSISLYHEVLEAVTVALDRPPSAVCEFNEGDFEAAANKAHFTYGAASASTVNQMLEDYGF